LEFGAGLFYKSEEADGWQEILNATLASAAQDGVNEKATQALFDDVTIIPITYYSSTA
jgi:hypothetical protein